MLNCALEFTLSTCHADQYMKPDRAMLFTQQKFVSECDVTFERYCTYFIASYHVSYLKQILNKLLFHAL